MWHNGRNLVKKQIEKNSFILHICFQNPKSCWHVKFRDQLTSGSNDYMNNRNWKATGKLIPTKMSEREICFWTTLSMNFEFRAIALVISDSSYWNL